MNVYIVIYDTANQAFNVRMYMSMYLFLHRSVYQPMSVSINIRLALCLCVYKINQTVYSVLRTIITQLFG